jgi:hypothetical protein
VTAGALPGGTSVNTSQAPNAGSVMPVVTADHLQHALQLTI